MKSYKMKKRLEKGLPYRKITPEAERRFDEILASLPDKEAFAAPEASAFQEGPRHYRKGEEKRLSKRRRSYGPEQNPLPETSRGRRAVGVAFRCAAALLFLCAVGLFTLNAVSPRTAESIPGLGGAFRGINRWWSSHLVAPQPDAVEEKEEKEPCRLTAEDSYILGGCLFLNLRLDTEEEQLKEAAWLSNEFNSTGDPGENMTAFVDGEELQLYSGLVFENKGGYFQGQAVFFLPEGFSGDKAEGKLEISALYGRPESARESDSLTKAEIQWEKPLEASFSAPLHPGFAAAMSRAEHPASCNGALLENYHWTEDGLLRVTISCPNLESSERHGFTIRVTDPHGDVGNCWYGREISCEKQEGAFRSRVTAEFDCFEDFQYENFQVYLFGMQHKVMLQEGGDAILAGFDVSPDAGTIQPIEDLAEYNGAPMTDIEDYAAGQLLGYPCQGHMFAVHNSYMRHDDSCGSEVTEYPPKADLIVCSDVDQDLPVEAQVYLDGEKWETIPLYRQKSGSVSTDMGYSRTEEKYDLQMDRVGLLEDSGYYRNLQRAYYITVEFQDDGSDDYFWANHRFSYRVVNTFTGEILCQAGEISEDPQSQGVSPSPEPLPSEVDLPIAGESSVGGDGY